MKSINKTKTYRCPSYWREIQKSEHGMCRSVQYGKPSLEKYQLVGVSTRNTKIKCFMKVFFISVTDPENIIINKLLNTHIR